MNVHEYQAKQLLHEFGIAIPKGKLATTADAAATIADQMLQSSSFVAVKAQIHSGGRGKAGGIKIAKSPPEAAKIANEMLGMTIVTEQTDSTGKVVQKLYIEEGANIKEEIYLSILLSKTTPGWIIVVSKEGGVNIEDVASNSPDKILKVFVDYRTKLQSFHIRKLIFFLNIQNTKAFTTLIHKLMNLTIQKDLLQLEINPLILTDNDDYMPLDAKIEIDDNALFKHSDIAAMRDPDEQSSLENEAAQNDLNYIKMSGSIGCMVNGAGLAMATMDIIKMHGGNAANFLDVGGNATHEKVTNGFKIILSDPDVRGIFVNIFGGIMQCDIIASGIIKAAATLNIQVPIVARLDGTNADKAKAMLASSSVKIHSASDLDDAADMIVKLAQ